MLTLYLPFFSLPITKFTNHKFVYKLNLTEQRDYTRLIAISVTITQRFFMKIQPTSNKPVTAKDEDHLLTDTHPDMLYGLAVVHGQPSVQIEGNTAHEIFLQIKKSSRRYND